MEVRESIKNYLAVVMEENGIQEDFADDESLIESGIIDSLSLLKLIAFIDTEFQISLTLDELDTNNFDTTDHMVAFIERRVNLNN